MCIAIMGNLRRGKQSYVHRVTMSKWLIQDFAILNCKAKQILCLHLVLYNNNNTPGCSYSQNCNHSVALLARKSLKPRALNITEGYIIYVY